MNADLLNIGLRLVRAVDAMLESVVDDGASTEVKRESMNRLIRERNDAADRLGQHDANGERTDG